MAKDNSGQFLNFSAKDKNTPKPKGTDNESNNNSVNVDVLTDKMGKMKVTSSPKFIVNTIMYVDGTESESSSDKGYTDSDKKMFAKLGDLTQKNNLPYRSSKVTKNGTKSIGFIKNQQVSIDVEDLEKDPPLSKYTQPFLNKLYSEGVEKNAQVEVSEIVSASILLNRPLSVSTRKNNLLKKELYSKKDDHPITHKKFGVFWQFTWYDKQNTEVSYSEVKTFYKKLKRYDKDKGTSKAEAFLETAEKGINVPYQELREFAKNHAYTKKLIQKFRSTSPDSDIYMSFIDADTLSFNGIYSAYLRIHSKSKIAPTIMSTGYEFTKEQEGDHPFVEGSKLDRQVRIATAKHFPLGVYYPEPNFCALIKPEKNYLEESFVDKTTENLESAVLIRSILVARKTNVIMIFENDRPLLTTIPLRVRDNNKLKFSEEFKNGVLPTDKDISKFEEMNQSHIKARAWKINLYINRGFSFQGNNLSFNKLLENYLSSRSQEDKQKVLEQLTGDKEETLKKLEKAYEAKETVIAKYKEANIRTPDMQALLDYIESVGLVISSFTQEFLNIIVNAEVLDLLKNKILDLQELKGYSNDCLKRVLYNDDIIEMINKKPEVVNNILDYLKMERDKNLSFIDISDLLEIIKDYNLEFNKFFYELNFSIPKIIRLYYEHPDYFKSSNDALFNVMKITQEKDSTADTDELMKLPQALRIKVVIDPESIIGEGELESIVDTITARQAEIDNEQLSDLCFDRDAYDIIAAEAAEEGCPDELLYGNSSDNSDD